MKTSIKKLIFVTALILLFGQGANQVFCGDADCLEGGASENCTTLLCSLLGSHTNTATHPDASGQNQDNDCHCVCHLQFNHAEVDLFDQRLTLTGHVAVAPASYTSYFSHRIDHPPSA